MDRRAQDVRSATPRPDSDPPELRASAAASARSWLAPPRGGAGRLLKAGTLLLAAGMCSAVWRHQLGPDAGHAAVRGMQQERAFADNKQSAPARPLTSQRHAEPPAPPSAASEPQTPMAATTPDEPPLWAEHEADILERLGHEMVVDVRRGSGGRTLAFKVTLSSGIRAYFKPEQEVSSAHWYSEVAAYHLDRALGLHRVPPLVGRTFRWEMLEAAAGSDGRIGELYVSRDGQLRGALIFWLETRLVRAVTPPGWENWIRAEPFPRDGITPYQRASAYGAALRHAREAPNSAYYERTPAPDRAQLPAELSDMIVFDFLTINYDRFGGNNANILTLGPHGPLIFLDNGDGFSAGPVRRSVLDSRLAPLSRFRRRTVEALRAFDIHAFEARLSREPLAPILDAAALAGLAARREIVLEHVAAQRKRYGDVIFAW